MPRLPAASYRLLPWSRASAKNHLLIEARTELEVEGPKFLGFVPPSSSMDHRSIVESPRLEIIEFEDVMSMGGTDLLFKKGSVIHPSLFDPEKEVCPAEKFGVIEFRRNPARFLARVEVTRFIPEAISLIAQCEGNYAHFLVEVLPKLALVNRTGLYPDVPILMAKWTHPNLHAALRLVNKSARKIIMVDRWETVKVARLIAVSPTAYVTAEHRDHAAHGSLRGISNERFPFSRTALTALREDVLKEVTPVETSEHSPTGRYYIRRNHAGNPRRAINAEKIEELARRYGFKAIDPGSMGFAQQVSIFRSASMIVGQVGAALVNTLFSSEGCRILALSPYFEGGNYYFWSNLMGVLGHDLNYIVGPQVESESHTLHRDYTIDIATFELALQNIVTRLDP